MDVTAPSLSLGLFLLLSLLPLCPAENFTISDNTTNATESAVVEEKQSNTTLAECLIDNQMGLIAIGSEGGLIVCLLVTVAVLACQVFRLKRRVYIPRSSRSNLDLVGNVGYWSNAGAGPGGVGGGLVESCDTSVMLEEVKTREEVTQESGDGSEERFEEEGAAVSGLNPEEKPLMQSSASRESYLEVPRDLENMPLVV